MILIAIISFFVDIFNWFLSILPTLPPFPQEIVNSINSVLNIIFNYLSLLNLFVPLWLVGTLVPLAIAVSNLNKIWSFINWIWCHIPIFGSSK